MAEREVEGTALGVRFLDDKWAPMRSLARNGIAVRAYRQGWAEMFECGEKDPVQFAQCALRKHHDGPHTFTTVEE